MKRSRGHLLAQLLTMAVLAPLFAAVSTVGSVAPAGAATGGGVITTVQSGFAGPTNLSVTEGPDGDLYIAATNNHRVYRLDGATSVLTVVAGTGLAGFSGDGGPATSAKLDGPYGVVVDDAGVVYISDFFNNRVRKVAADGTITTIAGDGFAGYGGDGGPATSASLHGPDSLVLTPTGELLVADWANHRVRKIDTNGVITTIVGSGNAGYNGENVQATSANLLTPFGLALDGNGNLFVSEQYGARVRKIGSDGLISTVAGTGEQGYTGDGAAAINARLQQPHGIAVNDEGHLFIADRENNRVRVVIDGVITTIAGTGAHGFSGDGGPALSAELARPHAVAIDDQGDLLIADTDNGRIRKVDAPGSMHWIIRDLDELWGAHPNTKESGDPVNMTTGAFTLAETDLEFPAETLGLELSRVYNSVDEGAGVLGVGWSSSFDQRVFAEGQAVVFVDGTGRRIRFLPNGSGWFRPESFRGALEQLPDDTYQIVMADGHTRHFDTDGNLDSISDWTGQTVTISRDGSDRVVSASSSTGRNLTFSYTDDRLTSVTADDGRTVAYSYDVEGDLATVVDPTGAIRTFTTDTTGLITEIRDAESRLEINNTYDSLRRVSDQNTPHGGTTSYSYDITTGVTTQTDLPAGDVTTFRHDRLGRVSSITDDIGNTTTVDYSATGEINHLQDRRSATSQRTFDDAGNPLVITNRDGDTETLTWDTQNRLTSRTDQTLATWTFTYEGTERLPTTVTDPNGRDWDYTVTDGLITVSTDPDGVTTTFTYNTRRDLTAVTDGVGDTTTFAHDAVGRVSEVTSPPGDTTTTSYDLAGRVVSVTDPRGATTTNSYNNGGDLISVTDAIGKVTAYTYNAEGDLATTTDADGNTISYTYNGDGDLTTITEPGNAITTYAYGPLGRLMSITDPVGGVTSYAYDANGNVTSVTDPEGGVTTTTYDPEGRTETVTDPENNTTTYTYTADGRVHTITDPEAGVTTYTYTPTGQVQTVAGPGTQSTTYTYTPAGRVERVTDADGVTTSYTYDGRGDMATVTDGNNNTWTRSYDTATRTETWTSPEGRTTKVVTDPSGNVISETDANGRTTTRTWSLRNELLSETAPGGAKVRFYYTDAGDLRGTLDARNNHTYFWYDGRHNRTSQTGPDNETIFWYYDKANRLLSTTDQLNRTTFYVNDLAGRRTRITDPSGRIQNLYYDDAGRLALRRASGAGNTHETEWIYDGNSRVVSMTDPTGTTTQQWDPAGNLVNRTSPGNRSIRYSYTAAGRRLSLTYPEGDQLTYGYDPAGRNTTISRPGATQYRASLDKDGMLLTESLDNDMVRAYGYTGTDLTTFVNRSTDTEDFTETSWDLDYNNAGWLSTTKDETSGLTNAYSYDIDGQLTQVTVNGAVNEKYTYDTRGRRTSKSMLADNRQLVKTDYAYDKAGQLKTAKINGQTVNAYSWDGAGRLTKNTTGLLSTAYYYDSVGKPTQIQQQLNGAATIDEKRAYSGDGTLMAVTYTDHALGAVDQTTSFDWDTTLPVPEILSQRSFEGTGAEMAGTATPDDNYLYGNDGRVASFESGLPVAAPYSVISHDPLGNNVHDPTGVEDETRSTRDVTYSAWGQPATTPANPLPAFGYRGELHLQDAIYLRNRDYLPDEAIFTTPDPLDGVPGTPTLNTTYHYANNNPTNLTDPLGLRPGDDVFRGIAGGGACPDSSGVTTSGPFEYLQGCDALPDDFQPLVIGSAFQRFLAELDRIERASSSNDDFVRTAAQRLGGFVAGRFGLVPEDRPGGYSRGGPDFEILGGSGWRADFIDDDDGPGDGLPSPARHFIGWLAEGYFHPHVADDNLEIAEAGGPGQSMQDRRSGDLAIDLGIQLRRGQIGRRELLFLIEVRAGDPTNTFNESRPNEPTGGDPLACLLPFVPC